MTLFALLLLSALASSGSPRGGDEWPGWRGPAGNGLSAGSPPVEWSEEKNVRWKVEIPGKGNSSPVVWGDRVFVTTAIGTGKIGAAPASSDEEPGDRRAGERGGERVGERGAEGGEQGGEQGGERGGERGGGVERGDDRGAGRGGDRGPGREGGGGRGGFGGRGPAPPEEQHFVMLAFDRASGELAWEAEARTGMPPQGTHPDGSYATATPVTDGEHVIASFGSNGLFCYTIAGELVWEKDLGDMDIMRAFGEGSSPVLHRGTLIVNWDNEGDSFLVALDKATGAEKWRTQRPGGTSWCTPTVVDTQSGSQVIVAGAVTKAYDFATGKELWSYGEAPGGSGGGVISSAIQHGGLLLFSTGNRRGELRCLDLALVGKEGEEPLAWIFEGDTPHVPSPVAHDGIFYVLKSNSGLLSAYDVGSGERLYGPERMQGVADAYASPVVADGRLYFTDRQGAVEVVLAGSEYASLAVNKLEDAFDASPAIAGEEIFLRGRAHLYCIAEGS